MPRLEMPRLIECPRCGGEREIVTTGNTVLPGEVVVDFTVKPCGEWCKLLEARKGER